jgi:K(+)-stimulated pyrophosphate-energized sodium pump
MAKNVIYYLTGDPEIVLGFTFGASAMALFAKAGRGIYTKTARALILFVASWSL